MDTRKLYYEDQDLAEFTARVLSCQKAEKGYEVLLDRTAFYPEGGGQACDIGTLGDAKVTDVQERGEEVVHLCDKPLEVGSVVAGKVDYDRRFDLMQQHAGEHIVCGIANRLYGCHNVGFHVGADTVTVDLDVFIPWEKLQEIETMANRAVFDDVALKCWFPTEEELPTVEYRTKKRLEYPVRIVEIPGYDTCACCGLHVKRTGQIGLIKLVSSVKFHQGVRIEMVCGQRALRLTQAVFEENRQVSQAFSAKLLETGAAARRMNEALAAEKFRATGLEKQLLEMKAEQYRSAGDVVVFEELEPAVLREFADKIATVCGGTAAVFSGSDGDGYNVCLVSKSADVKPLGEKLGAKGGGKPGYFQGKVESTADIIKQKLI